MTATGTRDSTSLERWGPVSFEGDYSDGSADEWEAENAGVKEFVFNGSKGSKKAYDAALKAFRNLAREVKLAHDSFQLQKKCKPVSSLYCGNS